MISYQTTAPTFEPVTLEELKSQARISHTREDALLTRLVRVARTSVEAFLKYGLCSQVTRVEWNDSPDSEVAYLKIPATQVTDVKAYYLDSDSDQQTFDDDGTYLRWTLGAGGAPSRVILKPNANWPTTQGNGGAFWADVTHGFASPNAVPQDIRDAILKAATYWFNNRSGHRKSDSPARMTSVQQELQLPPEVQTMLASYQMIWL